MVFKHPDFKRFSNTLASHDRDQPPTLPPQTPHTTTMSPVEDWNADEPPAVDPDYAVEPATEPEPELADVEDRAKAFREGDQAIKDKVDKAMAIADKAQQDISTCKERFARYHAELEQADAHAVLPLRLQVLTRLPAVLGDEGELVRDARGLEQGVEAGELQRPLGVLGVLELEGDLLA